MPPQSIPPIPTGADAPPYDGSVWPFAVVGAFLAFWVGSPLVLIFCPPGLVLAWVVGWLVAGPLLYRGAKRHRRRLAHDSVIP